MNSISQKYITDVYTLFPVVRIPELLYLIKLKHSVTEYIIDNNSLTLDEVYLHFGKPEDIVLSYFSITDIDYIIKKMQIRRFIRNSIFIFSLMVAIAFFSFHIYTIKIEDEMIRHLSRFHLISCEYEHTSNDQNVP